MRERMADAVISKGSVPSPQVRAALREVPRHRFVPETRLETACHDDLAVVTVRESPRTAGRSPLSSACSTADDKRQAQWCQACPSVLWMNRCSTLRVVRYSSSEISACRSAQSSS